jgi:hypothetical protein
MAIAACALAESTAEKNSNATEQQHQRTGSSNNARAAWVGGNEAKT